MDFSVENRITVGDYQELKQSIQGEYLLLGFHPSSLTLKQRWRNNGLSADFLGDYVSTFFPKDHSDIKISSRQKEIRSAVSYIANELLENAMKNHVDNQAFPIQMQLVLKPEMIYIAETNVITMTQADNYFAFIEQLLAADPIEMFMEKMEAKALDDNTSGLGFLTMINDYETQFAWCFSPCQKIYPEQKDSDGLVVVTTEAHLAI